MSPYSPLPGFRRSPWRSVRSVLASLCAAPLLLGVGSAQQMIWNFGTSDPDEPTAAPVSSAIEHLNQPEIVQYNNNVNPSGNPLLLTSNSASPTAGGFSGGYNAGVAARVGDLIITENGSAAFEFTLIPDSGYQVVLQGITFGGRRTGTGPTSYTLRSSLDDYQSDIVTGSLPASGDWGLLEHSGLHTSSANPVTFRLFGYAGNGNATPGTANWRIDDLTLSLAVEETGEDTTPPTLTSVSPAAGAVAVPLDASLTLTFSEPVVAGAGSLQLYRSGAILVEEIPASSATLSGTSATVTPAAALDMDAGYYVLIESDAFEDAAGNPFAGISDPSAWSFTALGPDVTGPQPLSFVPAHEATDVSQSLAALVIVFDEPLDFLADIGELAVQIKTMDGTVIGTVDPAGANTSINATTHTVTIPLTEGDTRLVDLSYATSYFIEFPAGAYLDEAGNPSVAFGGAESWSFTTEAAPVPASLTADGYAETFASFTESSQTLPVGWRITADGSATNRYNLSPWEDTSTGIKFSTAETSVFGYQHSGNTGVVAQILRLQNDTGETLTEITVSYEGRTARSEGRNPFYTVAVNGINQTNLTYSTADGDNALRAASVTGLSIAPGAAFEIRWTSDGSSTGSPGSGSRNQIGISHVSVSVGAEEQPPLVSGPDLILPDLSQTAAGFEAELVSDNGNAVTAWGFVFAETSVNAAPEIGGEGVTLLAGSALEEGTFTGAAAPLTAATSYTVRAYATNSVGTAYTNALTFSTLQTPPSLVTAYTQEFNDFSGSMLTGGLPAGWTAISDGGINGYAGTWGSTSSGGLAGGVSGPGVLGYQHVVDSGIVTISLTLINQTGSTLTELYVSYLGRVSRIDGFRHPAWEVTVAGNAVSELSYSTSEGVDQTLTTQVTGLSIPAGETFVITWTSDRGTNTTTGYSRQIGIAEVYVGLEAPPVSTGGYTDWAAANAGGQGPDEDYDGDGVPNGVEYLFGETGSSFTSNPAIVDGSISWPYDPTAEATFTVQTSSDLEEWTDLDPASLTVTASSISYTVPEGAGRFFLRLTVSVP